MSKRMFMFVLIGVSLYGCTCAPTAKTANVHAFLQPIDCYSKPDIKDSKCNVDVTFGGGTIMVPEPIYIHGKYPIRIVWQLKTEGYEFHKGDGIVFKDQGNDDNEFDGPCACDPDDPTPPPNKGKKFHWRDKNDNLKTYHHAIKIYEIQSGRPLELDPRIINQG
jgi:hypothetical protein